MHAHCAGPEKFEARSLPGDKVQKEVAAWITAQTRGQGPSLQQKAKYVHDELRV
jgi:predicted lipoprotein